MMSIREELLEQLETVDGESLVPHFERDALVFVGKSLDIIDVGVAFANDNKDVVSSWLEAGDIWKCTEIDQKTLIEKINYQFLILQPFVLAKTLETQ